jgi:Tfp pilus tip-associated adhesin PilY1
VNCVVGANEGWRLDLGNPGEKILAPSITVSNEVFFTSYLPEGELDAQGAKDQCAPFEGNGRLYAVGLLTGAPINPDWSVGNEDTLDSADRYQKLTSTGIPSELVPLGPGQFLKPDLTTEKTKGSSHWKTYWYEKGVDL